MLGVDIVGDVHPNLAALSGECGGMAAFSLRMLQCIGYFRGIVTYLR
jgi:hypothetical protein